MRSTIQVFAAALAIVLLSGPSEATAQEEFQFHGAWAGEFEDRTEPERDMATRGGNTLSGAGGGGRDRMIQGRGRLRCDGEMQLEFRGPNDNLRGSGLLNQNCQAARAGTWVIPPEAVELSEFDFEDEGEGEKKKLGFRFEVRYRTPPGETQSNELIRCEADGEFRPDDDVFEGDYDCRHVTRLQQTAGRESFAIRIRGEFELSRVGNPGGRGAR